MTDVVLSLRRAAESDCALLFEWANDADVRANSFSSGPIPWATHVTWFARLLHDPGRHPYIVLAGGRDPIGQVRFDGLGNREAEISLSLAAAWRGRGLASRVFEMATECAGRDLGLDVLHAYVKPANLTVRRALVRAGYEERGPVTHRGHEAVHLEIRSRPVPRPPA
jgi:RimJ/RimL family protein N-acetyltransferase